MTEYLQGLCRKGAKHGIVFDQEQHKATSHEPRIAQSRAIESHAFLPSLKNY